ncbi:MAG: hypothetical protein AAB442_00695 [Patescibacteria group bacterium]
MAITTYKKGFALLIALIVMSVMLSFGLALGSLAYKQQVLASDAIQSQYAFYAADSALECALYADQRANLFDLASHDQSNPPLLITSVTCDEAGNFTTRLSGYTYTPGSQLIDIQRIRLSTKTCADVTVYKHTTGATEIYVQGYNASCATVASPGAARYISRGIWAYY